MSLIFNGFFLAAENTETVEIRPKITLLFGIYFLAVKNTYFRWGFLTVIS
jgi:hypothetical protein